LNSSPDSNGGKIAVAAENISLQGANTSVGSQGQGGNILLEGTTISMGDRAQVQSLSQGTGDGGNISVQGNTVSLQSGAQVQSLTQGSGNGGSILVQGNDSVSLSGANTAIFSLVTENSSGGNSGDITIEGNQFSLTDGAQLISATFGQGNAGKVSVNVSDDIVLSGANTVIFSSVGSGADSERSIFPEFDETTPDATAVGDSGGIDLRGRSLTLTDGAQITASTFDFQQGNAGNISIEMTENITLEGNSELNNPTPGEITQPTIANSFQNIARPSTANTPTVLVNSLLPADITGITPGHHPTPTPTPSQHQKSHPHRHRHQHPHRFPKF
jgi:large exoprotein involved in heme utilization and adhesion